MTTEQKHKLADALEVIYCAIGMDIGDTGRKTIREAWDALYEDDEEVNS